MAAEKWDVVFMESSAKTKYNCEEMFIEVIREMHRISPAVEIVVPPKKGGFCTLL